MILKKDKRKRKLLHDSKEENCNDKYIAYAKKMLKHKQDSKCKKETQLLSSSIEVCPIKKLKEEIKLNSKTMVKVSKLNEVNTRQITICAKPKMNKIALDYNIKKIIQKSKLNSTISNCTKKDYLLNDNIQLVTPSVALNQGFKCDNPSTSKSPVIQLSTIDSTSSVIKNVNINSSPVIVEANLKKSSNFYVPKILQNHEEMLKKEENTVKLQNNENNLKKNPNSIEIMEKVIMDSCTEINTIQSTSRNISQAVEEFYKDATKRYEALIESKDNSKWKKKHLSKSTKSYNIKDFVINNTYHLNSLCENKNNIQVFSFANKVILVLQPGTQFSILGKLKFKVLYGAVELYGSIFHSQNTVKEIQIYSPRGYSSISITTFLLDYSYDKESLWDVLTMEGVDRSLKTKLHNAVIQCEPGWSVLLLKNFENTLTKFLKNHCFFKLFPKIENAKHSWCDPKRAEYVLQTNFQFFNSANEVSICPQWNEKVTKHLLVQWNSTKSLCTMIIGGKGVGKSTTARYLINNLLRYTEKVILLDLDPGQAEMTPAASISLNILQEPLLGPNFTHLRPPFYQMYLEDVNVTNCVTHYIECVKKLVEYLKNEKDLLQYPIVVNTMGFCKGIGLEICIFLIKLIEPNNVIQILSKRPRNNFDLTLLPQIINEKKTFSIALEEDSTIFKRNCEYKLHPVHSVAEGKRQFESWNMEPRQQRELVLLSYFSQIIENAEDESFYKFACNTINDVIPYELPFSSFYVSLIKSSIAPTHILAAMNGNIVALCGIDLENNLKTVEIENLNYPLVVIKPPTCVCYGYGLVRGIDMNRRCIYINTPLTLMELRHVNLLAGCSAVPFSLLHRKEHVQSPYAADRGEVPTSRAARRGYFRVNRSKVAILHTK